MNDVLVAGLGNPLMADEGIGPRVVELVKQRMGEAAGVEFLDLGTPGLALLHAIRGHRRVLLVDCALMGLSPGTLRRFTPDEVRSAADGEKASAHQPDVLAVLGLAERMAACPREVVVFGIQPQRVEPGVGLSEVLAAHLEEYADAVSAELSAVT